MKTEKEIEDSNKEFVAGLEYSRRKLIHYNHWLLSDRPFGSLYPGFIEDLEPGSIYECEPEKPYTGRTRPSKKERKRK